MNNLIFYIRICFIPQTAVEILSPVADEIHVVETEYLIFEQTGKNKCFADAYGV